MAAEFMKQYDDAQPKPPAPRVTVESAPEMERMMAETNSLLRRLVLAMEVIAGTSVPDPD